MSVPRARPRPPSRIAEVGARSRSMCASTGPSDGALVLLLHGFPQTSWSWHRQVAGAGRRRLPGGRARPAGLLARGPTHAGRGVRSERAGRRRARVWPTPLGHDRFHLVGHDWGGAVAWQVAGRHAERLRTLTVLSTPHPAGHGRRVRGQARRRPGRAGRPTSSCSAPRAARTSCWPTTPPGCA